MTQQTQATMQGKCLYLLNGVSADGSGSDFRCLHLNRAYNIVISNTATVTIEGHNGDGDWQTLRTATASEAVTTAEAFSHIRATVSGYSSGTITVTVGY